MDHHGRVLDRSRHTHDLGHAWDPQRDVLVRNSREMEHIQRHLLRRLSNRLRRNHADAFSRLNPRKVPVTDRVGQERRVAAE